MINVKDRRVRGPGEIIYFRFQSLSYYELRRILKIDHSKQKESW